MKKNIKILFSLSLFLIVLISVHSGTSEKIIVNSLRSPDSFNLKSLDDDLKIRTTARDSTDSSDNDGSGYLQPDFKESFPSQSGTNEFNNNFQQKYEMEESEIPDTPIDDSRSTGSSWVDAHLKAEIFFIDSETGEDLDEIHVIPGDRVTVHIIITNTYVCTASLTYLQIRDYIPEDCSYVGFNPSYAHYAYHWPDPDVAATPFPQGDPVIQDNIFQWNFMIYPHFQPDCQLDIIFDIVIGKCGSMENKVSIDAFWNDVGVVHSVYSESSAQIICEYFIHVSDIHFGDALGTWGIGGGGDGNWYDFVEGRHPRSEHWQYPPKFILCTGDIVEYGSGTDGATLYNYMFDDCLPETITLGGSPGNWAALLRTTNGIKPTPIRFCPGNHDYYNILRLLGSESWSLDNYKQFVEPNLYFMDDHVDPDFVRVFSLNTGKDVLPYLPGIGDPLGPEGDGISDHDLDLLEYDLQQLSVGEEDYFKIIMIHNPYWNPNGAPYFLDGVFMNGRTRFESILNDFNIDLVLWGHTHGPCRGIIPNTATQFIDAGSLRDGNYYVPVYYRPTTPSTPKRSESDRFIVGEKVTLRSTINMEVAGDVRVDVYDESGNHVGLDEYGIVETDIPGSGYSIDIYREADESEIVETVTSLYLEKNAVKDYQFIITGRSNNFIDMTLKTFIGSEEQCTECQENTAEYLYNNVYLLEGSEATINADQSLFDTTVTVVDPNGYHRIIPPISYNGNLPPEQIMITGPSSGYAHTLYEYTVIAVDPEGQQISYRFDWGDGTNIDWMSPGIGMSATASHQWSENKEYSVVVSALDSDGQVGLSSSFDVSLGVQQVYVDDDFNETTPGWSVNRFSTIQDGIDAVASHGFVHVSAGEYNEEIVIPKPLGLMGSGKESTHLYTDTSLGEDEWSVLDTTVITIQSDYVSIQGFTIQGGNRGIRSSYNDFIEIANNRFVEIDGNDIDISGAEQCHIGLNEFPIKHFSGKGRIQLRYSSHCSIRSNSIENGAYKNGGIALWRVDDSIIEENTIQKTRANPSIYLGISTNNVVRSNIVNNSVYKNINYTYGIRIDPYSNENTVLNNQITMSNKGIFIGNSIHNTISENSIDLNKKGIEISYFNEENYITHNSICRNDLDGIYSYSAMKNTVITENTISENNNNGIFLYCQNDGPGKRDSDKDIEIFSISNNIIEKNTISKNKHNGIYIKVSGDASCENNTITGNILKMNTVNGIYLEANTNGEGYCRDNIICRNDIILNNCGICLSDYSDQNVIYHNNISDNTEYNAYDNAVESCHNYWNGQFYPAGGNYWGDHSGYDEFHGPDQNIPGSDFMFDQGGETGGMNPYIIPPFGYSQDNYPFTIPDGWTKPNAWWWPMSGQNFTHASWSSSPGPITSQILWLQLLDPMISSSTIFEDKVYVGSETGILYCLNLADGSEIWRFTAEGAFRSSPCVADGNVYIGSFDKTLYCLNADTGDCLWKFVTDGVIHSSPVVVDDKVFIGSTVGGGLYCLDADPSDGIDEGSDDPTGSQYDLIWIYQPGGWVTSTPAFSQGSGYISLIYPNSASLCLNKFDIVSGEIQWSSSLGRWYPTDYYTGTSGGFSSPTLGEGKVFVGSDSGDVYCFDQGSGDRLWQSALGDAYITNLAYTPGFVYAGINDSNGFIACLRTDNGDVEWRYNLGYHVPSSPVITNDMIYFGSTDGNVFCRSSLDGTEVWSHHTSSSILASPSLAAGSLIVCSIDGTMTCYKDVTLPLVPTDPFPFDGAIDVDTTETISWTGGSETPDDTITYEIYLGTTENPPLVDSMSESSSVEELTYTLGCLEYDTLYYWRICSVSSSGGRTEGPVWTFATRYPSDFLEFSLINPSDGSSGVGISPELSVTVTNTFDASPSDITFLNNTYDLCERTPPITTDYIDAVSTDDLDLDGDIDLLLGSYGSGIEWWENDGSGGFTTKYIISDSFGTSIIDAIDLDLDGDKDVLAAGSEIITWWENDGSLSFIRHDITYFGRDAKVRSVVAGDINLDGYIDVIGTATKEQFCPNGVDKFSWWENDGHNNFIEHVLDNNVGASDISLADINSDYLVDLITSSLDGVTWWKNDGCGGFIRYDILTGYNAHAVYTIDMNSDGKVDILSSSLWFTELVWWANCGDGEFGSKNILWNNEISGGDFWGTDYIFAIDFDFDNDIDIFPRDINEFYWLENIGDNSFQKIVLRPRTDGSGSNVIHVAELNDDGDYDILSALYNGYRFSVWENHQSIGHINDLMSGAEATIMWSPLSPSTNYRWKTTAKNIFNGMYEISPTWQFTTEGIK